MDCVSVTPSPPGKEDLHKDETTGKDEASHDETISEEETAPETPFTELGKRVREALLHLRPLVNDFCLYIPQYGIGSVQVRSTELDPLHDLYPGNPTHYTIHRSSDNLGNTQFPAGFLSIDKEHRAAALTLYKCTSFCFAFRGVVGRILEGMFPTAGRT